MGAYLQCIRPNISGATVTVCFSHFHSLYSSSLMDEALGRSRVCWERQERASARLIFPSGRHDHLCAQIAIQSFPSDSIFNTEHFFFPCRLVISPQPVGLTAFEPKEELAPDCRVIRCYMYRAKGTDYIWSASLSILAENACKGQFRGCHSTPLSSQRASEPDEAPCLATRPKSVHSAQTLRLCLYSAIRVTGSNMQQSLLITVFKPNSVHAARTICSYVL